LSLFVRLMRKKFREEQERKIIATESKKERKCNPDISKKISYC